MNAVGDGDRGLHRYLCTIFQPDFVNDSTPSFVSTERQPLERRAMNTNLFSGFSGRFDSQQRLNRYNLGFLLLFRPHTLSCCCRRKFNLPTAMAFVSSGFVLVRVRVRVRLTAAAPLNAAHLVTSGSLGGSLLGTPLGGFTDCDRK